MSRGKEYFIQCDDQKDLEEKRVATKKETKENGTFLHCEENTILLKNGDTIKFIIDDPMPLSQVFDTSKTRLATIEEMVEDMEEPLPPEAFDEEYQRNARDAAIAREAAREQIE